MRETILGNHLQKIPSIAVGCMRLSEKSKEEMTISFTLHWNRAHISSIMRISMAAV